MRTMPKNVQDARRVDPLSTVYTNTFSVSTLAKVSPTPTPRAPSQRSPDVSVQSSHSKPAIGRVAAL